MTAGVSVERIGSVVHLVLDAPERRNALSRPMLAALAAELSSLDDRTTGVVISGRGTAFSAGADFAEITGTSADVEYDDAVSAVRTAITYAPCLAVAALEGPCLGAAADLALACDVRIAAEGSTIHVPAVRLGLLYNPAALRRATRELPLATVRRLFLLGERFTAAQALAGGLVSHVVPDGESVEYAVSILTAFTPDQVPALAATKAFLAACTDGDETRTAADPRWERLRLELLDSPARAAAIAAAHARHTTTTTVTN